MISTTPIDTDMIVAVVGLCFGTRDRTQMVSTVAGTDPVAKSPATRQSTLPFLEWVARRFRHGGGCPYSNFVGGKLWPLDQTALGNGRYRARTKGVRKSLDCHMSYSAQQCLDRATNAL